MAVASGGRRMSTRAKAADDKRVDAGVWLGRNPGGGVALVRVGFKFLTFSLFRFNQSVLAQVRSKPKFICILVSLFMHSDKQTEISQN